MKNVTMYVFIVFFAILGCSKDSITTLEEEENLSKKGDKTSQEISKRAPSRCVAVDYNCTDYFTTIDDMYGIWTSGVGSSTNSILDNLINCPPPAISNCRRDCASVVEFVADMDNMSFILFDYDDGAVFPASLQLSIVNAMKALALAEAPMCGNKKMIPYSYNLDYIYNGSGKLYTTAQVTYIAPCNNSHLLGL